MAIMEERTSWMPGGWPAAKTPADEPWFIRAISGVEKLRVAYESGPVLSLSP